MADESKKSQEKKKKNDPKEQRKPRNSRNQGSKNDKKVEIIEETKSTSKVVSQKPPVYQDPGPEFYKNLKRETDEILKISEEESSKYKKKEIQSNWSKYEMPVESYEEIEEQNEGADYEKLIQAPLSVGGHFQFKHEKAWDTNLGPSLYDKYFDIDMENLSVAISTIPFYQRNDIDISIFSETDITNMKNRAAKFQDKYQNCSKTNSSTEGTKIENNEQIVKEIEIPQEKVILVEKDDINLDFSNLKIQPVPSLADTKNQEKEISNKLSYDDLKDNSELEKVLESNLKQNIEVEIVQQLKEIKLENEVKTNVDQKSETKLDLKSVTKIANDVPVVTKPAIESPEDLEKWLDDFLDG